MPRLPFDLEARRPYLVQAFTDAEYARRVDALRTGMEHQGLDALIIYAGAASPSAAVYLTNFGPAWGNAFVIVRADGEVTVTTDAVLHGEPMHSMIWTCRVPDVRVALGPIYGGAVDEVAVLAADAVGGARRVGLAGTAYLPQPLHAALARRLPRLRPADDLLAAVRLEKSDEEIDKMREAGRGADSAMEAVFETLRAGLEETEIAAAAVRRLLALGAREAFPTCVVAGAQAGLKHGMPRRRALRSGELVFIDLGAACDGYMSDLSRCTMVGRATGSGRDLLAIGLDL